jgi:hypothetical protein
MYNTTNWLNKLWEDSSNVIELLFLIFVLFKKQSPILTAARGKQRWKRKWECVVSTVYFLRQSIRVVEVCIASSVCAPWLFLHQIYREYWHDAHFLSIPQQRHSRLLYNGPLRHHFLSADSLIPLILAQHVKPWVPSWRWQTSWQWRWRHFNWLTRPKKTTCQWGNHILRRCFSEPISSLFVIY